MLFKKSKRKNITVQKALEDNRWIAHITPVTTTQEITEYVTLWEAVGHFQLRKQRRQYLLEMDSGWGIHNQERL